MTEDQQNAIERHLVAGETADAPAELRAEDVDVQIGGASVPRREAA